MQYFCLALILCLLSCVSRADEADANSAPAEQQANASVDFQHDGVWKPKGAMLGGVLLPPPALEAITLTIQNGKYKVTVQGEDHADEGTFSLDETVTPMRMTIRSTAGPNKGKTFFAIYEIKNVNAMRVCYDLSGKEFPKEFKAPKDTELYLVGYRRQEPKAADSSGNLVPAKVETAPDSKDP